MFRSISRRCLGVLLAMVASVGITTGFAPPPPSLRSPLRVPAVHSIQSIGSQPATSPFAPRRNDLRITTSSSLFIFASDDDDDFDDSAITSRGGESPALVVAASRALRRTEWLSWWAQVILTTITSVTLLFARSVIGNTNDTSKILSGFFWAGTGILSSCLSILWTWGGARLARRWRRQRTDEISAACMLRRAITVGAMLNLVGMGMTLLGCGQIVGGLAIKVLTTSPGTVFAVGNAASGGGLQTLQPLDILIVQASTNLLLSHYLSLVALLYLVRYVDKLDPPSVPEK